MPAPPVGCGVGQLTTGTHTSRSFRPTITYTVPVGWENGQDWPDYFSLWWPTLANDQVAIIADVTAGDLGVCSGTVVQGSDASTAIDIAEVLSASEGNATTEPVPVTIGGLSGNQLDMRLGPGWNGTCPDWSDQSTDFIDIRRRLIVLDTPAGGNLMVSMQSLHSADFPAFLEAAMPVVESFRFDFDG